MPQMFISTSQRLTKVFILEPLICHLKMGHIKRLGEKLDPSYGSGISNWCQLAHSIYDRDPKFRSKINDLELHYYGGGNPALKFFASLKSEKPHVTVGEFQNLAHDLNRNDVYVYIEDHFSQSEIDGELRDVDYSRLAEIASKLNLNIPGVNGWDMFANEYGYSHVKISNLKTTIKDERSFSPTNKLVELLMKDRPTMRLQDLREFCSKLSRNDVASLLDEIIKEINKGSKWPIFYRKFVFQYFTRNIFLRKAFLLYISIYLYSLLFNSNF